METFTCTTKDGETIVLEHIEDITQELELGETRRDIEISTLNAKDESNFDDDSDADIEVDPALKCPNTLECIDDHAHVKKRMAKIRRKMILYSCMYRMIYLPVYIVWPFSSGLLNVTSNNKPTDEKTNHDSNFVLKNGDGTLMFLIMGILLAFMSFLHSTFCTISYESLLKKHPFVRSRTTWLPGRGIEITTIFVYIFLAVITGQVLNK